MNLSLFLNIYLIIYNYIANYILLLLFNYLIDIYLFNCALLY